MNFLKGVLGFGKKDKYANFLEYRGEGRMYLIQRKNRKCVFILAEISFIQGKKSPWERYIFIKNKSEESEFNTNEYYFLIKNTMDFRTYNDVDDEDQIVGFEWSIDNGATVCFEFGTNISDDLTAATDFKHFVCRLQYEHQESTSAADVPPEELEDFCMTREDYLRERGSMTSGTSSAKTSLDGGTESRLKEYERPDYDENVSGLRAPVVKKESGVRREEAGMDDLIKEFDQKIEIAKPQPQYEESKTQFVPQKNLDQPVKGKIEGNILLNIQTSLCELGDNGNLAVLVPKVNFLIVDEGHFQFFLEIFDEKMNILYKKQIQSDINYHVDESKGLFKWVEVRLDTGDITVYASAIPREILCKFKVTFAQCMYETNTQEPLEATLKKPEEREYAKGWFANDVEPISEIPSQEDDEMEIEDDFMSSSNNPVGKNTGFVQAKVLDRSFVSKGSTLSVFMANDDENTIEHIVSLPPVKSLGGIEITPKKMMMHEQDTKVLMLSDPATPSVYYMDLTKGKIVSEFEGDGQNRFTDLAPVSKHASFTTNPCFITSNARNLFLFDPRVNSKSKVVQEKIYAQTPQFTCMATHGTDNYFAVGSETGEIRLYSEVGKNAKTLFPGLGDRILGLDSTMDGKWLLVTTKTYLMVIQTIIDGKNGYKQSISKDRRVPFKLTILPQDIKKYRIKELSFLPAKFNDNEKSGDKFIVASTAEYLVTWSMKHVLRGQTEDYEIKRLDDFVVSNEFRFNKNDNLLVTLPKDVRVQKTKFFHTK